MEHCPTHGGRLWIQPQSGKDRFDNQPLEDGRGDLGLARAAVRAALQVDVEYALAVVDQMRRRLTCAAQRLERFLGLSDDAHELASLIPHNSESFYFNDAPTKAKALEVFGF